MSSQQNHSLLNVSYFINYYIKSKGLGFKSCPKIIYLKLDVILPLFLEVLWNITNFKFNKHLSGYFFQNLWTYKVKN